jgi:hypothetical protein
MDLDLSPRDIRLSAGLKKRTRAIPIFTAGGIGFFRVVFAPKGHAFRVILKRVPLRGDRYATVKWTKPNPQKNPGI